VADPFRRSSSPAGGFGRALRSRRVTAFEVIEDLLARAENVRGVGADAIRDVCETLGVDLRRKYLSNRKQLYRRYLANCLEDRELSQRENADLEHLRSLLHLAMEDVASVHDEVAREVYGKAIQDVLADLKLDSEEEAFLRRLRGELQLPEKVAGQLFAEGERNARDDVLRKASSRDRLFLKEHTPAGEFTGRSTTTIEDAVAEALAKATVAIPSLHWFELKHIAGYVEGGQAKGWHVILRAGVSPEK
jgi:flavin-binding protein dodecin